MIQINTDNDRIMYSDISTVSTVQSKHTKRSLLCFHGG